MKSSYTMTRWVRGEDVIVKALKGISKKNYFEKL